MSKGIPSWEEFKKKLPIDKPLTPQGEETRKRVKALWEKQTKAMLGAYDKFGLSDPLRMAQFIAAGKMVADENQRKN